MRIIEIRRILLLEISLIVMSALLLALAFIIPFVAAPFVLFFLMPLYMLRKECVNFKYGFLWGLLFYSLYFYGIFILILDYASGFFKIPLFFIFLLYCASTSGLWFVVTSALLKIFILPHNNYTRLLNCFMSVFCWTLSTFLYFLYIHYLFFLPLGAVLGNKLNNPLIISANFLYLFLPHTLYIVQLFFFLGLQASLFLSLVNVKCIVFLLIFLIPYGYSLIFLPSSKFFSSLDQCTLIACVPHKYSRTWWEQATSFSNLVELLSTTYEKNLIILNPESAFPLALNYYQELYALWFKGKNNHTIIMGAYRFDNDCYYNSLYVLQQCRITQAYDKQSLTPLIEYIPSMYSTIKTAQRLFLKDALPFAQGTNKRDFLSINGHLFTPCICSEFFFDVFDNRDDYPLLVIVNDSWFNTSYIQELFLLYAQYQALILSKSLIYVGYTKQCIINSKGQKTTIPCYMY